MALIMVGQSGDLGLGVGCRVGAVLVLFMVRCYGISILKCVTQQLLEAMRADLSALTTLGSKCSGGNSWASPSVGISVDEDYGRLLHQRLQTSTGGEACWGSCAFLFPME